MTEASPQAIQNVSDTAFLVAGFRALESERPQPLFRDPLAARLAGEHGAKIVASVPKTFGVSPWLVAIRTVTIDDLITKAVAEGVDTVLNLGAGLDTRPYRMALPPALRWVEVDYPHVIALKEECLAGETPRCRLDRVSLDLVDHDARRKFLADAAAGAAKVLVLTEGVTPYLTEIEVAELADDLRRIDAVHYWINDYYSPESHRFADKRRARFMRNAPLRFRPQDWFAFFAARGWLAREVRYIAEEGERLGRPIPLPLLFKLWVNFATLFASQERRDNMRRFVAYVLLTPK
jgi:methyltransferase (TIGR00027 family)